MHFEGDIHENWWFSLVYDEELVEVVTQIP